MEIKSEEVQKPAMQDYVILDISKIVPLVDKAIVQYIKEQTGRDAERYQCERMGAFVNSLLGSEIRVWLKDAE